MKAKKQVRNLAGRFQIETPHVEHVASLALQLADGFGFDPADRPLLAAAARLHDIGYASDPEHHVNEGVRILEANPLPAFSSADWKAICLIVSLHRRNWRPQVSEQLIAETGRKTVEKAKRLAAVLRIADGLDHGHIQDASLRFCRRGREVDQAGIAFGWYEPGAAWAGEKTDLWEAVFKRPLRIRAEKVPFRDLFGGVVDRSDSTLSAARKIFYSQYDVMRDRVPGMLDGTDPECLHDYRVALRRFRTALRLFRSLLTDTSAAPLADSLRKLSDRMGPIRDEHVLLQFFQTLGTSGPGGQEVFQCLEKRVAAANTELVQILESEECLCAVRQLGRFLRVELPSRLRNGEDVPDFKRFVKKRLKRIRPRIEAAELSGDPEQMHAVRKLCRRGRYLAEFAAPLPGGAARRAARALKAAAGALGDLRDLEFHCRQLEQAGFQSPEQLAPLRAAARIKCSKAWKNLKKR